ncbi:MAG: pyruvate kinase [Alphaproteobacteria bacterium]|nr:pyruvate kinase [Alphaproteobacteria bacterium]
MTKTNLLRSRRTKILATLGPASTTEDMIRALFEAGVDVFRLNFSHGKVEDHKARLDIIRKIEKETGRPIGIVADLQGPKLRVGRFKEGKIDLQEGQTLRLDLDTTEGDEARVNLPHPEVIGALAKGALILLDDGKVRLEVTEKGKDYLVTRVIAGKTLSNNKGFNIPGTILPLDALTEKDRRDLAAALDMGVDWVAQSFVQKPEDVAEAKKLIAGRAGLIAKIEKPSALQHMAEIIDLCDAIMLARGDLGVEIPPEEVPSTQKKIVRQVRYAGKPIIVATQMLESMIDSPAPTRAEASDVATAVYDGTDCVMLSAETASGKYPLEAVTIMSRIAERVEKDDSYRAIVDADHPTAKAEAADAITVAADQVARDIRASCITTYTSSGTTTLRTARLRPAMPILCLTEREHTARRMALSYGVYPVVVETVHNFGDAVKVAQRVAKTESLAAKGEKFVMTAGVPFGTPGSTNILRVAWVE